jgi:integration host factor subunit beta
MQAELSHLRASEVEGAVDALLDAIGQALIDGRRIELRGFGAFSVRERDPRIGRNPRTGETVAVAAKRVPFFKPGKELRMRVNGEPPDAPSAKGAPSAKAAPAKPPVQRARRSSTA